MRDLNRSRSGRRTRIALVALAALAALLAGCTGIPRDGGVHAGQEVEAGDNPAPVFLPSHPQKDATQEGILHGFIEAASSPEGNYAIAREFLAPAFSNDWDPGAGVTVDDALGRSILMIDPQTMQFSVNPVAEVDADGEYHEVESSAPVPLRYQFVQVDGQWRISQAPNGTVIDETTFSDVFSPQTLYFFDPGFSFLVPDLRWFPRGASAPTRIVKGVLAGPSPWLVGAVATAFPEGTKLNADAVQVVARDAKVDLNAEALNADRITMQRMKAQLVNSLPAGLTVTMSINQNVQDIGDLRANGPILRPRVDARALILRAGEFGFLGATGADLTPVPGLSESIVGLHPSAVALAAGQGAAALLAAAGVYGILAGESPKLLDPREGLVAPSIDNFGYTWSVPSERPGELFVYDPAGDAIAVPTVWQEATSITAIGVSRDGTRLIALLTSGSDSRFVVAAIKREKTVPVGLGDPVLLSTDLGVPLDATWVDELTVATLSVLGDGEERIVAHQIGGVSTPLEPAPSSVTITGGNGLRDLRAVTSTGGLEVQRGVGWQERIDQVVLIATQQGIAG